MLLSDVKLPEAEPDMPKMHRHGGFSLFYPWCAPAHLRPQKQTSIRTAILFGARSFPRDGFRAGKAKILTQSARIATAENHIAFGSRQLREQKGPGDRKNESGRREFSVCLFVIPGRQDAGGNAAGIVETISAAILPKRSDPGQRDRPHRPSPSGNPSAAPPSLGILLAQPACGPWPVGARWRKNQTSKRFFIRNEPFPVSIRLIT